LQGPIQHPVDHDAPLLIAVFMGAVSATFGGLVRDVLLNEPSLFMKQDVYVTAALAGAAAYIGLIEVGVGAAIAAPIAAIIAFLIRAAAILFNISVPKVGRPRRNEL
ncbi:MAG TPA: TRIC cation channel family protein, partial [Parvularculaceae bacterium]|nr:TRIC cation channel family protein [Parvularculaceae bacterium]